MKKMQIVPAALMVATVALLASCSSGRHTSYAEPYPPVRSGFSLVIHSSPGMVINRYHDGRYYYRSPQGYTYWRGYDNRYYLDRSYIHKARYNRQQYNNWRQGHKKYYRNNRRR